MNPRFSILGYLPQDQSFGYLSLENNVDPQFTYATGHYEDNSFSLENEHIRIRWILTDTKTLQFQLFEKTEQGLFKTIEHIEFKKVLRIEGS